MALVSGSFSHPPAVAEERERVVLLIKSFDTLSTGHKRQLFEFVTSQTDLGFTDYSDMATRYGSGVFAHGKHHLSLWRGSQICGAMALVTREISKGGQAFVTDVIADKEVPQATTFLLGRMLTCLLPLRVQTLNVGVPASCEHISPVLVELGFEQNHKTLVMRHDRSSHDAKNTRCVSTQHLGVGNLESYRRIHNAAFSCSPNGATVTGSQVQRMLTDDLHAGLCIYAGKAVGIYQLAQKGGVGWVQSIAVHPDEQGRGIGRSLMFCLCEFLYENEARQIKLKVMSNNEAALRLYQKCGFERESVSSLWFVLNAPVFEHEPEQ